MNKLYTKKIKGVHLPKTELGQQKLERIRASAEKLFIEKNFYNTSIVDICKHAGVAVGTFYIYFDDKQSVYRMIVLDYKYRIRKMLKDSIISTSSRREKERDGIKAFVKYVYENPYVYDIIWGSLSVDRQLFVDYYDSFARNYAYVLTESHEVADNIDVSALAYTLMGITNFISLKTIFEGEYTEEMFDELVDKYVMDIIALDVFKN